MPYQAMAVYPPAVHPRALNYTRSILSEVMPDESELTAGVKIAPGRRYGFFTDTSVCIGCKACEVACKEWNTLPADGATVPGKSRASNSPESRWELTGMSYDNTAALSATTWRHVAFVEKISDGHGQRATVMAPYQSNWLMMSDVCKHCEHAGCLEACPTGALFRTEFDTVVVQQDICNGCGYCVPSCPFGVIATNEVDGKAHKCTLCYDRMKGGLEPACAKACPTNSIQFGEVEELRQRARRRLADLYEQGVDNAYLYGLPGGPGATGGIASLSAFFLLLDRPEVYNLPQEPSLPSTRVFTGLVTGMLTMVSIGLAAALTFVAGGRQRRNW